MENYLALAIDGGHSSFKVRGAFASNPNERFGFQVPTALMPAVNISNEATRVRAEKETIEYKGKRYFFGQTALKQGNLENFIGLSSNWIESEEHDILLLGCWRKMASELKQHPTRIVLVMGLPAKYYSAQKQILQERVYALVKPELAENQQLVVIVNSQPDAPLQTLAINRDGKANADIDMQRERWAAIEIGHFTTDFIYWDRGDVKEYASVSCPGVHLVYESIAKALTERKLPSDLDIIDEIVHQRKLKIRGNVEDMSSLVDAAKKELVGTICDNAIRLFGSHASIMDGMLIGGGGASLVIDELRNHFPDVRIGDEPRMLVAEGFCRVALAMIRYG